MMRKNRRFCYRSVSTIVFLLGLLFWFFNVQTVSASQEKYGGEYRIPLSGDPLTLDPAFYTDIYSFNVAENLFDGLVQFSKDLRVVPAIAKRWKISRDHRTYTFLLRKGVKFHNGREVTADDFIFSFTRILDPKTKSPVISLFLDIRGAKMFYEGKAKTVAGLSATDPYTLNIELERPFAPFLSILAMINAKVVPKEAMGPDFATHPVGTGPFRFHSWEPAKNIILENNPAYFGGKPFLNRLYFRIYPNVEWEKIFSDFEKGLLDQSLIPSHKYELISNPDYKNRYTVISKPGLNLVYIAMNSALKPFGDRRVRQAVSYAADTATIVSEITKRGSVPAKGVLPPGIAGFNPRFKGYSYDPRKARELLAEAGYPGGKGIPPLEIWTVSKSESVKNEILAYQKYLADIGIQLIPKVATNWKEFIGLVNEKKVPIFYMAWYADYPDADNFLHVLFHSESKTNRMGYSDPETDKLLEQARKEMDYMTRVKLYQEIEKRVMQDAPIICQHINSFNYLFQPWVNGIHMNHLGAIYLPFQKIWIDSEKR
ncbi:ABC transporter substrate-binding protein [Desulfonema magnum]|uniref:ABC transporter, substrate-binding protein n=1 Tax=Desulfonema magnum TaxID=45655 RepID=A0A975BFC8_9BACT|nr:ABC transporter substrate-binding protein [Desulfonema magnum]QTA84275.1 putative ABC transporter, substrate-binding protein [Desulfonema magnum]